MIQHSICRKTTNKWCEKSNMIYYTYDDAFQYPLNTMSSRERFKRTFSDLVSLIFQVNFICVHCTYTVNIIIKCFCFQFRINTIICKYIYYIYIYILQ